MEEKLIIECFKHFGIDVIVLKNKHIEVGSCEMYPIENIEDLIESIYQYKCRLVVYTDEIINREEIEDFCNQKTLS